jgi:arylsulfatase A-like enzyme
MIEALHQRGLWNRTMVIISAKHGQSPIDRSKLAMEGAAQAAITDVQDPLPFINTVDAGLDNTFFHDVTQTNGAKDYAIGGHLQTDDVGILWLQNQSAANMSGIVAQLSAHAVDIHASLLPTGTIFSSNIVVGPALSAIFGDPSVAGSIAAARAPNVFIQPNEGVIYSGSAKKIAEHGGGAPGDTGVALLVAGGRIARGEVCESVMTTQVAPTILEALGLPGHRLEAVRQEKTQVLPGLDLR